MKISQKDNSKISQRRQYKKNGTFQNNERKFNYKVHGQIIYKRTNHLQKKENNLGVKYDDEKIISDV